MTAVVSQAVTAQAALVWDTTKGTSVPGQAPQASTLVPPVQDLAIPIRDTCLWGTMILMVRCCIAFRWQVPGQAYAAKTGAQGPARRRTVSSVPAPASQVTVLEVLGAPGDQ